MTEEQARKLAGECAEQFEALGDDETQVQATYCSARRCWRVAMRTGNLSTVFYEVRPVDYMVSFHRSSL